MEGTTRHSLNLDGTEVIDILGLEGLTPRMELMLTIHRMSGSIDTVPVLCRVDTADEAEYYRNGGILQFVLRQMAKAA
jgi:aconitate hydratase